MIQNGNDLKQRLLSKKREQTVQGNRGIEMINHGSLVTISVKTPLGRLFRCETKFIGSDGTEHLVLTLPKLTPHDLDDYFCEGFWITVKAISDRGEGAIVNFKSQVAYVINKPVGLLLLKIPHTMSLMQLRSEPRYEVKLQGHIPIVNRNLLVDFKDLSAKGCCFQFGVNGPTFDADDVISITVKNPSSTQHYQLTGTVRSMQKNGALKNCGVMFDGQGQQGAKQLLAQLIFDGSSLSFKQMQL
ncbi:flagellar brake protein [Photobacterium sagamiensis]|uniref:flagellar brake protein n=1 Tax=Photobacterium sagamiensis TaxID=2910241 RepID=UPI003D0D6FE5